MQNLQLVDLKGINRDFLRNPDYFGQNHILYPRPEFFKDTLGEKLYTTRINNRNKGGSRRPLSLFFQLPFCNSLCCYCGNHQLQNNNNALINNYVNHLVEEIRLLSKTFRNNHPKVEQIFLGGGSPALLNTPLLSKLMREIETNFNLAKEYNFHIRINPKPCSKESILQFREMGVNSITIDAHNLEQDSDQSTLQKKTENETFNTIQLAKSAGFQTIKIALVYGLPKQNKVSFGDTLNKIIAASPDLISLRCFLHQPNRFKSHKAIHSEYLPSIENKFTIRLQSIDSLTRAGYIHIGLNLFARHDNQLVTAQRQGRLHYDLQGFSIYPENDFAAFGISAIGKIGPAYFQNHKDITHYFSQLDEKKLPVMRGLELKLDDILRRSVMHALICHSVISFESVETFFSIDFKHYFATELSKLSTYENAGLLRINDEEITVTAKGKLFIGSICMIFDKYIHVDKSHKILPKNTEKTNSPENN